MIYNALPVGIPVNIDVQNTSGSAQILKIAAQAPSGQNYVSQTKQAGTSTTSWTDLTVSGVSILVSIFYPYTVVRAGINPDVRPVQPENFQMAPEHLTKLRPKTGTKRKGC